MPPAYIRQRIEIRNPVDDLQELYQYDNGLRVGRIKLLDKKENAHTFQPRTVSTNLFFRDGSRRCDMHKIFVWIQKKEKIRRVGHRADPKGGNKGSGRHGGLPYTVLPTDKAVLIHK